MVITGKLGHTRSVADDGPPSRTSRPAATAAAAVMAERDVRRLVSSTNNKRANYYLEWYYERFLAKE